MDRVVMRLINSYLDAACAILTRTPAVLKSLLTGLPDDLMSGGKQDEWSPFDIVGHLIHGEVTDWIPRRRDYSPTR